jgi:predicted small secreted protein
MRRTRIILLELRAPFVLGACNTVEGVGKDLKQGGEAIGRAAKK